MLRLHPIRRISARRLRPKQSWIKTQICSIRCISSMQPFDASCSRRRHSPPQLPLHLVPQREFMAFAFRGGAALVFTLAFYVGIQVATRLPPMQRMYIRRRLGRLQRGVDVTADTGKLTLNRPEKFGFFDNILSRAPAGPLVVTGPEGSGKSTLLHDVMGARSRTLIMNLREKPPTSAGQFVSLFLQHAGYLFPPNELIGRAVFVRKDTPDDEEVSQAFDLVTEVLRELQRYSDPSNVPVICIDEMHELPDLHTSDSTNSMLRFLDWCIFVTDARLCHVVLSCPTAFADILDKHPGFRIRRERVYIDFPRQSSVRTFFADNVNQWLVEHDRAPLAQWEIDSIEECVGGQLKDLDLVLTTIRDGRHWSGILQRLVADSIEQVEQQLERVIAAHRESSHSGHGVAASMSDVVAEPITPEAVASYRCMLRFWRMMEVMGKKSHVSRRELINTAFRDNAHEIDTYINAGLLMCYNLKTTTTITPSPGQELISEDATGRFVAAASPRLRVAFRALLTDKKLLALKHRVERRVKLSMMVEQEEGLVAVIKELTSARDSAISQREAIVLHRGSWHAAVEEGEYMDLFYSFHHRVERLTKEVEAEELKLEEVRREIGVLMREPADGPGDTRRPKHTPTTSQPAAPTTPN